MGNTNPHGPYSQGGFKGRGRNRMVSQKPSNDGCAFVGLAMLGGLAATFTLVVMAAVEVAARL